MREFRALHAEFARAHVTLAGVSVDSPGTNQRWMERLDLPYPLLTDREHHAGRAFGILSRVGIGPWSIEFLRRATVLIARDGQIAALWNRVKVRGHAAEVLKMAQALERAAPSA